MLVAGLVLALVAVLVVFVSEATARGNLGINGMLGLRFGAMMTSEAAWQAGHRAARVPLDIGGALLFVAGILVMALPLSDDALGSVVLGAVGVLVLLVAVGAVRASRAANRTLLETGDDERY